MLAMLAARPDKSLRRALVLTDGGLIPFFARPVSLILLALTALTVLLGIRPVAAGLGRRWERLRGTAARGRG